MSESVAALDAPYAGRRSLARAAVVASYGVLGAVLLWSRLANLGKSFWFDEVFFVVHYVREGPRQILTGPGLSHELYGLLVWATGDVVGESEVAYRLWSVVPFIAGVGLVTVWLHRRFGPVSALAFLFLATVSPLLLDITRQARGYGLAFFAMCVLVVAALEALSTERRIWVPVACLGGVVGAWTLPQFALGFIAVGAVLVTVRALRPVAIASLLASVALIYVWFAPHTAAVQGAAQIPDGRRIGGLWVVTAPIDQILLPALLWIEGVVLIPGLVWLPLIAFVCVVSVASPLLRPWRSAAVLLSAPVATVIVLAVQQAYVIPRYLSFLAVPFFVLLATGAGVIVSNVARGKMLLRAVFCAVAAALLTANFVHVAPQLVALPKEDPKQAAEVIRDHAPADTPVYVRLTLAEGLAFYLGRPVHQPSAQRLGERVCGARRTVAYVMQPFPVQAPDVPCLARPGVQHYVFQQYTRGGETNVWILPTQL